jgi:hypothetical protein
MSFEKRKADAFLTIKLKEEIKSYEQDDGQLDEKQYAKIKKLVGYELDKSTGEVVRLFDDERS